MSRNFSTFIHYNKQKLRAVFVPVMEPDGLHYEVNIKGYPRFTMSWSALGRYDLVNNEEQDAGNIPYELILAASDILEKAR